MANFNFGAIATSTGVSSSHMLKAYEIHRVKLEDVKLEKLEAKHGDNAGKILDVIKVRFSNEQGYYEESVFLPSDGERDSHREPNNWGGWQPSNLDRFQMFITHTLKVLNPEGLTALQEVVKKAQEEKKALTPILIANTYVKLLSKAKGKEVDLKLVGRVSNGIARPSLPYYTGVTKDGVPYVSSNFLSDPNAEKVVTLVFTASELKKKADLESLVPTDMNKASNTAVDAIISTNAGPSEDVSDLANMIDNL